MQNMHQIIIIFIVLSLSTKFGISTPVDNLVKDYLESRSRIFNIEHKTSLGQDLTLEWTELKVNSILIKEKIKELDEAMNSGDFGPAKSFYLSKPDIEKSPVFQFIKKMPKGAALHTHHISLGSIKWIVSNLTYW